MPKKEVLYLNGCVCFHVAPLPNPPRKSRRSLRPAFFNLFAFTRRCNRSELRRIQWSKYKGGGSMDWKLLGPRILLKNHETMWAILAVLYLFYIHLFYLIFDTHLIFEWKLSQRQVVVLTLQVSEHWKFSNFMTNPHVPYERKFLKLKNLFERSTRAVVINFFKYCIFIIFQVPVVQFFHSKLGKHAQKLHKKHQKKNRLNPCFPLPLWPTRTPFAQRWRKRCSFQLVKPLRSDVTFERERRSC